MPLEGIIEDLRTAWNEEDKSLQTNRFKFSKYGGFPETKSRASGYFRVEKIDGKWWFIDPEGHYFISAGSTGINPGGSFARTEGREMELINVILEGEDTPMKAALQKFLSGGDIEHPFYCRIRFQDLISVPDGDGRYCTMFEVDLHPQLFIFISAAET